jgi:uncharacterized damage-inducible protein DinB
VIDDRVGPSGIGDERQVLREFLDYQRATLAMKCQDLSDDELRRTAVPTSSLSLLGLVRHMAEVEREWFRHVIGGETLPLVWSDERDFQVAYDASSSTRAEAFGAWEREVDASRRIEGALSSWDVVVPVPRWEEDASVRVIVVHVLTEYCRHNGHADLVREAVDGVTGA